MTDLTLSDFDKLIQKHGSGRRAAEAMGMARTTFQDAYARAKTGTFTSRTNVNTVVYEESRKPQYFIITSAQDSTTVHAGFLKNLEAYADSLQAKIYVSGFTYNKSLFEDHNKNSASFPSSIERYMSNDRVKIGQELMVCCEMNTLPTAVNPLSGFHNYTGMRSGIFPHPKVQLESVPTMRDEPAKMLMTTGAVTKPNYIPKKAGIKAEYHHILGAVIVELKPDGGFFARHLIADDEGNFYDLDRQVKDGVVTKGHRVEAITWGDIHRNKLDVKNTLGCWGPQNTIAIFYDDDEVVDYVYREIDGTFTCLADRLNPAHQFFHDVLDFEIRNHHNIGDYVFRFKQFHKGMTVEEEIIKVAEFLESTMRDGCVSVVVESNHDLALEKWLKTADYRTDPANAEFMLEGILRLLANVEDDEYSVFYDILNDYVDPLQNLVLLGGDESYKIGVWDKGGIECGLHGHHGLNGARGNSKSYTKIGVRTNTGHEHRASIYEGVYVAGITAKLDHGYNVGPSAWNPSHIITYANVKRAIVTMDRKGRYTTFD